MHSVEQKWDCPACGFAIFNRRYAKCERCGEPLPNELLYSKEELQRLQEQDSREDEERQEAREREHQEQLKRGGGQETFYDSGVDS